MESALVLVAAALIAQALWDRSAMRLRGCMDATAAGAILAALASISLLVEGLARGEFMPRGAPEAGAMAVGLGAAYLALRRRWRWALKQPPRRRDLPWVRGGVVAMWAMTVLAVVAWSAAPLIGMAMGDSGMYQYVPPGFYMVPLVDAYPYLHQWGYAVNWGATWAVMAALLVVAVAPVQADPQRLARDERLPARVVYPLAMIGALLLVGALSTLTEALELWENWFGFVVVMGDDGYGFCSSQSWMAWLAFAPLVMAIAAVLFARRAVVMSRLTRYLLMLLALSVALVALSWGIHALTRFEYETMEEAIFRGTYTGMAHGALALVWAWTWYMALAALGRRTARRVANQQCIACGYDLRAGHERCPECGRVGAG